MKKNIIITIQNSKSKKEYEKRNIRKILNQKENMKNTVLKKFLNQNNNMKKT